MKALSLFSILPLTTIAVTLGFSTQAQAGSLTVNASSFGNYSSTGSRSTNSYLTGRNSTSSNTENRSYFVFDLAGNDLNAPYRRILNSQLILTNPANGYVGTTGSSRTLNVSSITSSISQLRSGGTTTQNLDIFNDLGTTGSGNTVYGSTSVSSANNNNLLTIDLGTNANNDIRNQAESSFAVGGALTLNGTSRQVIFNNSTAAGTKQLLINYADAQGELSGNQQFGNVLVGRSANVNLTVTNIGELGSQLTGVIGDSSNPLITATSGSQSFTNLESGQSATRTFTFTPNQRSNGSSEQATINITSNSQDPIANPRLTGFGVAPQNQVTQLNTDAGFVRIGTQRSLRVNVANVGDGNLSGLGAQSNLNGTASLTSNSNSFVGQSNSLGAFSLGDNASRNLNVVYRPTGNGAETSQLSLDFTNGSDNGNNQSQQQTITLAGYGVGPQFESSPLPNSVLDFGTVRSGEPSLLSLVISNTSQDPTNDETLTGLTLLDFFFDGSNPDDFSLLNFTPGTVLRSGESLALQVQFNGSNGSGLKQSVLRLQTDQGAAFGQIGQQFAFNVQGTTVPEPSTVGGLLGIGSLASLIATRKKKGFPKKWV